MSNGLSKSSGGCGDEIVDLRCIIKQEMIWNYDRREEIKKYLKRKKIEDYHNTLGCIIAICNHLTVSTLIYPLYQRQ